LDEVASHYARFGGVSPIHARTRELIDALREELRAHGVALPIYWGNRFAPPFVSDALRAMRDDGARRAIAIATSALPSYSGCRAYLEDVARARAEVGEGAPEVDKIPPVADRPGYVETCVARLAEALDALSPDRRGDARVLFSAHSIPIAMAERCAYVAQLEALAERVAGALDVARWQLVYQSRSGPPRVPWLEPDVRDALDAIARDEPGAAVVVAPFGFVADHMEIVYDLDVEARERAAELGLTFVRAAAANAHPRFVRMLRELVEERLVHAAPEPCAPECCSRARIA
jgi:ferrochelatase